jgi:RHS repeat-associated protein
MRFVKCLLKIIFIQLVAIQFGFAQITYPNVIQDAVIEVPGITTDNQIYALNYQQRLASQEFRDGLGRLVQKVNIQASPTQKDVITFYAFNSLNQQVFSYLPYDGADGSGFYRSTAITDQTSFYTNGLSDKVIDDTKPWSQNVLESSPLQRILNSGMNGVGFQPISGDHYKSINYRSNNSTVYSNDALNTGIRVWNYDGTSASVYSNGSLTVTEMTDESGNLTIYYIDALGRPILKRQIISPTIVDNNTESCLDTYYVYDDANELRVIIPPKAVTAMRAASWSITVAGAVPLVYLFNYDIQGRLVERKIPGSNMFNIVYDPMNRPVLIQDGNLASANKWIYLKYDRKDRKISQGIYVDAVNGTTRTSMQAYVSSLNYSVSYYEEKQSGGTAPNFYTNRVFPTANQDGSALQDLAYNYFDDYDFNFDGNADYAYQVQGLSGEAVPTALVRGVMTGIFMKTLNNDNTLNVWIHKITFYDKRGNIIQILSNNHTNVSAADTKTIVPDFIGKTLQLKIVKNVNAVATSVLTTYGYDYSNRLVSVDQSNNGAASVRPVNYIYNELGQLVNKKLHSTDLVNYFQNIDYRYNINQKLTSINNSTLTVDNTNYTNSDANDLFGEEILYDKLDAALGNTPYFNGNISAVKWEANPPSGGNQNQRSYYYSYDQLNRLTSAKYQDRGAGGVGTWGSFGGYNDETGIQYDLNGNMEKLKRNLSGVTIDDLTYNYVPATGNWLINVTDATSNSAGFNPNISGSPYVYDNNGNLITDPKRGTGGTTISYNSLNRTDKINFTGTSSYIRYTYDGSGTMIRKEAYNGTSTTTYDYIDGFVFQNQTLSYFSMAEGRVRYASGFTFEYFMRDHLGNVRASFDGSGSSAVLRQETSYYSFGMIMQQSITTAPNNNNLFNGGSEMENDLGNLPDYYQTPNRNYDAILGRFISVDPLAIITNSISPYQFAENNPININDPTGDLAEFESSSGGSGLTDFSDMNYGGYGGGFSANVGASILDDNMRPAGDNKNAEDSWLDFQVKIGNGTRYTLGPVKPWYAYGAAPTESSQNGGIYSYDTYQGPTTTYQGINLIFSHVYFTGATAATIFDMMRAAAPIFWNSGLMRVFVPDLVGVNINGTIAHVAGVSVSGGFILLTRGKDAGLHYTFTAGVVVGEEASLGANFVSGSFLGKVGDLKFSSLLGNGFTGNASFGYLSTGVWGSYDSAGKINWLGGSAGGSFGGGFSGGPTWTVGK